MSRNEYLGLPALEEMIASASVPKQQPLRWRIVMAVLLVLSTFFVTGASFVAVQSYLGADAHSGAAQEAQLFNHLKPTLHNDVTITGLDKSAMSSEEATVTSVTSGITTWGSTSRDANLLLNLSEKYLKVKTLTTVYETGSFTTKIIVGTDRAKAKKQLAQVDKLLNQSFYESLNIRDTHYNVTINLLDARPKVTIRATTQWRNISTSSYDLSNQVMINLILFVNPVFAVDTGVDWRLEATLTEEKMPPVTVSVLFTTYRELLDKSVLPRDTVIALNEYVTNPTTGVRTGVVFTPAVEERDSTLQVFFSKKDSTPVERIREQFEAYWTTGEQFTRSAPYYVYAYYETPKGKYIAGIRR